MPLSPQIIKSLMFEHFRTGMSSQVMEVVNQVAILAVQKRLAPTASGANRSHLHALGFENMRFVPDYVQQVMWQLLAQGVLVWGLGAESNNAYPFYRLTEYGRSVVEGGPPQPYDPDGFIAEFDRVVANGDAVLRDYLVEAVRAFNANCFKSAAVMLGAASERAVLQLHASFDAAIQDATKRAKFQKDSAGITISKKYVTLKDRLDLMVTGKKLPFELAETVGNELPSAFHFIRRCRNDAGHPEIPTQTDPDTVFLNLRVFTEYARRVQALATFFGANAADW
jgi:hypothetical protein